MTEPDQGKSFWERNKEVLILLLVVAAIIVFATLYTKANPAYGPDPSDCDVTRSTTC